MENTLLLLFIIALFAIALLLYLLFKCKNANKIKVTYFPSFPHVPFDTTQIVLWKRPDATAADFKNYIANKFPGATTADIKYCGDCDDSLVVVSNIDINLFLSGQVPNPDPSRKPPPVPVGHDGPFYYSPNFPMVFKDVIDKSQKRNNCHETYNTDKNQNFPGEPVTVAVFDTGIDTSAVTVPLYQNNDSSCMGAGADNGWNFADHIADWNDDYQGHHGSIVSKFIADQSFQFLNNPVHILPVKVFSKDGNCLLSDILCALQYAKNRGANIINASFGFYAPKAINDEDEGAAGTLLFKRFLENYFAESSILMMAAAGNKDDVNEQIVYQTNDAAARRNLENVSFYPASFARTIPNIFAVTTVSTTEKKVSPHQNFSPKVVDIGVEADVVIPDAQNGDMYLFFHPYESNSTVEGSSFATPVVTGKIAANYSLISDLLSPVNKEEIINRLAANGLLQTGIPPFETFIKDGSIMNK